VNQSGNDQSGLFEREGVTRAHGRKLGRTNVNASEYSLAITFFLRFG
jgi:hypothetical protein